MNSSTLKDGVEARFHPSAGGPFISFLQMRRLRGSLLTSTDRSGKRTSKNPQRK